MDPKSQNQGNPRRTSVNNLDTTIRVVKFTAQTVGRIGALTGPVLIVTLILGAFTFIIMLTTIGENTVSTLQNPQNPNAKQVALPSSPLLAPSPTTLPPVTSPFAPRLFNSLQSECGGLVRRDTIDSCLKALNQKQPPFNNAALTRLYNSVTTYNTGVLQCVDFVQAILLETGLPQLLKAGKTLDLAIDHAGKDAVDGYDYIRNEPGVTMRPGDIAIWEYKTAGHMAYITEVSSNNKSFEVVEANWGTPGSVAQRGKTREISDDCRKNPDCPKLVGWLRKK